MQQLISRRTFLANAAAFAAIAAAGGLTACGGGGGSSSGGGAPSVRIGTMPTEDILPLWVAERDGLFADAGVQAEIVVFDSAPNLSAAITAGEVDLAMTDTMRAVKLCESGTDVTMEWVTLGADAGQGRFGVLLAPDDKLDDKAKIASLADLAEYASADGAVQDPSKAVGVAANTVPEYVFDKLCEAEGIGAGSIPVQEVASLPDRYSLVASGQLAAGAFPGSLLALGEASGLRVIADDTRGDNISQSVMVARAAYVAEAAGAAGIDGVRAAWDAAANAVNADPESYRALLIEKANLNDAVADTYPISTYPLASGADGAPARPEAGLVEPVLAWMADKGYSEQAVSYDESDGSIHVG